MDLYLSTDISCCYRTVAYHRRRAIGLSHTIVTCYQTIAYHRDMLSDYRIPSRHAIGLSHTIGDMLLDYCIQSRHVIGITHTIATCYWTIAYHRDMLSDDRIPSPTCYRTHRIPSATCYWTIAYHRWTCYWTIAYHRRDNQTTKYQIEDYPL